MSRIIRNTSYTIESDNQLFPVSCGPVDGSEKITVNGSHAIVSYLVNDEANEFYFDISDNGVFITNDRHCRGQRKTYEEIQQLRAENPGRFFVINKYEHSAVRYYRADNHFLAAQIPDKQWDVSNAAAFFISPDDYPDPAAYCDAIMKEFTSWCNGEIYGICHAEYKRNGDKWDLVSHDECWQYIGYDYAHDTLEDEHTQIINRKG